jgi:hypothetical protein
MATRVLDGKTNFGKTRVQADYDFDSTTTTVVLESGDGADLPAPVPDGDFNLTVFNATDYSDSHDDPNREIVRVTARSTDTLTITRGQEGTTGKNHNTSGKTYLMILGLTKKDIDDIDDKIGEIGEVAFRVNIASDQSIASGATATKVNFDTVDFDETTEFDTTNKRYTATRNMILQVNAQIWYKAAVDQTNMDCILRKNGADAVLCRTQAAGTGAQAVRLVDTIKLNNTDYIEIFTRQLSGSSQDVDATATATYWSATEYKKL